MKHIWAGLRSATVAAIVTFLLLCVKENQVGVDYKSAPTWLEYSIRITLSSWLRKAADRLAPPANRLLSRAFDLNQLTAIYCCAKVGWPDVLGGGTRSGRFLANHANLSKMMSRRLLRACVVAGVFIEARSSRDDVDDDERIYSNTDMGGALRSNHPNSMKHFIQLHVEDMAPGLIQIWNVLKNDSMIPFALAHGYPHTPQSFWRYFSDRPRQSIQFQKGMIGIDALGAGALVQDFPWGDICRSIVDVGGGHGSFLARILDTNPTIHGVLFEVPSVVTQAEAYWADKHRELLGRTSFVRGDFFDEATIPRGVEGGGTCFALKKILHDWDDGSVEAILRNVAGRMSAEDRIFVVEFVQVVPQTLRDKPLYDLQMLVLGGRERSVGDYRRLFAAAGLTVAKAHPTRSLYTIVEGRLAAATPPRLGL